MLKAGHQESVLFVEDEFATIVWDGQDIGWPDSAAKQGGYRHITAIGKL
jgi:hypothetical protein